MFEKIAQDNNQTSLYKRGDFWFQKKDFSNTHFANTSGVAAKALLTEKQVTIKRYDAAVLKSLGADDVFSGRILCCWPSVFPMVPSRTVQVGNEYTADLALFSCFRGYYTSFFVNDQDVTTGNDPRGVEFKVQGAGKKYWKATFTYFTEDGEEKSIIKQIPYTVIPRGQTKKERK